MKKIHFLGIAGSGTSAAAAIAKAQGFQISGCDKNLEGEFIGYFKEDQLYTGHSPDHLKDVDLLATTPAIFSLDPENSELLEAKKLGIPVLTWQEFTGKYLEKDKFVIAVSGTHGKSTTTAMVGLLLEEAGLDPTVELGAVVSKWETNYRVGKSKYFVTEADEFNDNFLASYPDITVCTTIEMDHPEYFKDFESYKESFQKFFSQTKEKIIANLSDQGIQQTLGLNAEPTTRPGLVVGSLPDLAWQGAQIMDYTQRLIDFPLKIPGRHNISNASAVYQVGLALGIKPEIIKQSLMGFTGIGRRFEKVGELGGAEVYSDFAHHPTEIKVTMEAVQEKFPDKKIILIFQPHMFSRTYALFDNFVKVLKDSPARETYILDIYPSREVDTGLVNSQGLVEAIDKPSVKYSNSSNNLLQELSQKINSGNVVIFMGAGDNHKLAKEFVSGKQI